MGSGNWIGFDLDCTLAEHHGFVGPYVIGNPIKPIIHIAKSYIYQCYDVRIFTARVDGGLVAKQMGLPHWEEFADIEGIRKSIESWCLEHLGKVLPITNVKDFGMVKLYDDRAIGVQINKGLLESTVAFTKGYESGILKGRKDALGDKMHHQASFDRGYQNGCNQALAKLYEKGKVQC